MDRDPFTIHGSPPRSRLRRPRHGSDQSSVITTPDGSQLRIIKEGNARFGMQAPLLSATLTFPSGLTLSTVTAEEVTLDDPRDPTSVRTLTMRTTVNGPHVGAHTRSFRAVAPCGLTGRPSKARRSSSRTTELCPRGSHRAGPIEGAVVLGWNLDLQLASETVAGHEVAFEYDADGLLIRAGALALARNAANGLLESSAVGDVTESWTYNALGEPMSTDVTFAGAPIARFEYERDAVGRILRGTETIASVTAVSEYEYDTAAHPAKVTRDSTVTAIYSYDANGNRAGGVVDAQDRLLSAEGRTYTYTAAGALKTTTTAAGSTAYDYDVFGNLRAVDLPNGTRIEYLIDAQNRRVGRKVNGTLDRGWLYSDQLRVGAELDGNGAVVSRFVYATRLNVPDLMIRAGVTYKIVSDQVGSVRLVINTATSVIAQALTYDEFGNILSDSNPGFQPFGFAGGLFDRDTGLVRFGARDYDPHTGRWTAKDPIGFGGGDTSLYNYCFGDPVNAVDPSGLSGTLTIQSSGDGRLTSGHSWIEFTPDGGTKVSCGTWGNNPDNQGNGLHENMEIRHRAVGDASRTTHIGDAAEARLMKVIERYRRRGPDAWSNENTCSRFARDAWRAGTREDLESWRNFRFLFQDNWHHSPSVLKDSIIRANGGVTKLTVPQNE